MEQIKELIGIARMVLEQSGGQAAGSMEIASTSVEKAYLHADRVFQSYGRDLDTELPDFRQNYPIAQSAASRGSTRRREMPVIGLDDIKGFMSRLKKGMIDVSEPYKPSHEDDPFPEGLSGPEAEEWLQSGLKIYDGKNKDDKVKVGIKMVQARKLKPIQRQIYFDKSIEKIAKKGSKSIPKKLANKSILVASSDNYLIDGHHRYLSAMLVDPSMKVQVLAIDLPISILLPMSKSYGDAIGNPRNL